MADHHCIAQGYMVEMPAEKGTSDKKRILVCTSCARAMRGRYKLKRVEETSVDFYCAMGCGQICFSFSPLSLASTS